jgi:flavin-dependent dehydrogenase
MNSKGPITDVLVIGSGPAGCAAALTCAKAGLNVIVVTGDKEQDNNALSASVRIESMHPGVVSLLNKIGIASPVPQAIFGYYEGIYANGNYTGLGEEVKETWQGFHIRRDEFENQLTSQLQNSGIGVLYEKVIDIILQDGHVKGIKTKSRDVHSRYVIDGSGKNAVTGKALRWKQQFFSPPLVCWTGVSHIDNSFELDRENAHFIPGENTWTWLAPGESNECAWTRLSMKGEKRTDPPEALKDFPVKGVIEYANMRWRLYRPVCSEGILLCGDAAGVLDPAAGQGILNALWSGMMAGNAVISCWREPHLASLHLAYYDDWFVQQFEKKVEQLREYYEENGIVFSK